MALRYGLPYFLEDKTGRRSAAEYVDMYNRMRLHIIRREHDAAQTVFDIYDVTETYMESSTPEITLYFGPGHVLGTVRFRGEQPRDMALYLSQINEVAGSRLRRFFASDGKEYRWGWRKVEGEEWTCTNSDAEVVADYSLKLPVELPFGHSSGGGILTVSEDYGHLACEMLATVSIMRHILRYDL